MKSKILTLSLTCAFFLFGMSAYAQSAKRTLTLTKQVTVEQVQQMNVDELVALMPVTFNKKPNKSKNIMKIKLLSFLMALFCVNFALAQDPVLDCAAMGNGDGTVCAAGLAAFSASLSATCGLANTEYVISDPTMTIDPDGVPATGDEGFAVLGASATAAFDPTTFGVGAAPGSEFCVTAVCFDVAQIQALIDAIYGNSSIPILSCCALVESQFAGLCASLMAAGINSGADITSLQDVITIAGAFSGGAVTLESVVGVIGTLNANLGTLGGVGCDGGVTMIDYMIDGVDEGTNTGAGVTCCFTVLADTDAACTAPVSGCTDAAACNFDAAATEDDGSCIRYRK